MVVPIDRRIYHAFTKTHGLTLKADALKYLKQQLSLFNFGDDELKEALDIIIGNFKKQEAETIIVDRPSLERIVTSILHAEGVHEAVIPAEPSEQSSHGHASRHVADNSHDLPVHRYFHIVDNFHMPRWRFFPDKKTFVIDKSPRSPFADASVKGEYMRDRFEIVKQRLLRNDMFADVSMNDGHNTFKISSIKSLHGSSGNKIVFGMLSYLKEDRLYLEDLDDSIELDLSKAKATSGYFTETSFVICQGHYHDDLFRVSTIGFPPSESKAKTRAAYGHINFLNLPKEMQNHETLLELEAGNEDSMFVVLSDVWLDSPAVISKLRTLFSGFTDVLPTAFVFLGNFMSHPFCLNGSQSSLYRDAFSMLADLICEFGALAHTSKFIFVPGPNDPWNGELLPRPPLPESMTSKLRNRVPGAIFASNPCRIRFFSQDIVFFRDNLVNKIARNAIPISDTKRTDSVEKHMIRTICDEAHLIPLPLAKQPLHWAFDGALRLYPLPDALFVADKYDSFQLIYEECNCINPGSFPNSEFSFVVYYPLKKVGEFSQVSEI